MSQDFASVASSTATRSPLPSSFSKVYAMQINGDITEVTTERVRRDLDLAAEGGHDLVILELTTYGGLVSAAVDISQMIATSKVPVVVWVRGKAISAGALIATSGREMVWTTGAILGDALPVAMGEELAGPEREKAESIVRAEFRKNAQLNGYHPGLSEAMATLSDGFTKVARKDDPKVTRIVSTALLSGYVGGKSDVAVAEPERGQWVVVREVLAPQKLLTLSSREALELGFARAEADSMEEISSLYNISGEITSTPLTTSERLTAFLAGFAVRSTLMLMFGAALWLSIMQPGQGLPEVAAGVLLVLLLIPPLLTGMTNWLEIGLILIGIALLAVELFILPGFGIIGLLGIVCVVTGMALTYVVDAPVAPGAIPGLIPSRAQDWTQLLYGTGAVMGSLVGGLVGALVLVRYMDKLPGMRALIPPNPVASNVASPRGMQTTTSATILPVEAAVGEIGLADSDLRPSGRARIGDRLVQVMTNGQYVTAGTRIRVRSTELGTITVEPIA